MIRRLRLLTAIAVCTALAIACSEVRADDVVARSARYSQDYANDMTEAVTAIALPPNSPQWTRVNRIVARLGAALGQSDWTVIIFQEARMPRHMDVPAFAIPGRRIAVSDWEVLVLSDDTLAFMLAHEMGHVELGHQNQIWELIMKQTGLHPRTWTDLAKHASVAASLARSQEYEADKFGFTLAQNAGFDAAQGARALFANLPRDDMHPSPLSREAALGIWP